jgi:hypothetical protein
MWRKDRPMKTVTREKDHVLFFSLLFIQLLPMNASEKSASENAKYSRGRNQETAVQS